MPLEAAEISQDAIRFEAAEKMRAMLTLDIVPGKDKHFCQSLMKQLEKNNQLSDKQWYWVVKLVRDGFKKTAKKKTEPSPQIEIDYGKLVTPFAVAAETLKNPKVVVEYHDFKFRLTMSQPHHAWPGAINVAVRHLGEWVWVGRVHKTGVWQPSAQSKKLEGVRQSAVRLLTNFAADPVEFTASYGKKTGNCCFCSTKLTDPKSTEVGYGPVCAQNYGLPWGVKK